jgi:hypothetical protein
MDSGFMPNINNTISPAPQMAMQVTVATPICKFNHRLAIPTPLTPPGFYCKQNAHCGKGMTFSINPTTEKTQAMFKQMAIAQKGTGATAGIVGGTVAATTAVAVATTAAAGAVATAQPAGIVAGNGNTVNGVCACSCFCGVAAFPVAAQGAFAVGGMSG